MPLTLSIMPIKPYAVMKIRFAIDSNIALKGLPVLQERQNHLTGATGFF